MRLLAARGTPSRRLEPGRGGQAAQDVSRKAAMEPEEAALAGRRSEAVIVVCTALASPQGSLPTSGDSSSQAPSSPSV